jgi:DNA-binding MarR family transcriptional regulator
MTPPEAADGSLADQIISQMRSIMSHQRHKWAALCQAYGLSMTHFQLLTILDADGPTAMSRLAERLNVGYPNVTGIVGRLEERGVVARVHDATDRRIVLADLTAAGGEMLRTVEEARLGHMRQLVETMNAGEQRTVLSALQMLAAARERLDAAHDPDHTRPDDPSRGDKEMLHA